MCVLVTQLCLTLCGPIDYKPTRFLCPWNSSGKNTGVGCRALLQGIFLTQGSNLGLPQILYHLSHLEITWRSEHIHVIRTQIKKQNILSTSESPSVPLASLTPVHRILQARILEWVAVPSSRGSSQPSDQTCVSYVMSNSFATLWSVASQLHCP